MFGSYRSTYLNLVLIYFEDKSQELSDSYKNLIDFNANLPSSRNRTAMLTWILSDRALLDDENTPVREASIFTELYTVPRIVHITGNLRGVTCKQGAGTCLPFVTEASRQRQLRRRRHRRRARIKVDVLRGTSPETSILKFTFVTTAPGCYQVQSTLRRSKQWSIVLIEKGKDQAFRFCSVFTQT